MSKCVAIITARGGSKRIYKKNIKEFCGKPIIAYSIQAALESEIFDEVMVSTDDKEIAEVAQKYGAKVPFFRSPKTSDDYATTKDVLLEVVDTYKKMGKEFEYMCCIYPTAPFITSDKLRQAFDALITNNGEQIMTVVQYSFPPQRCNIINSDGVLEYKFPENRLRRSQDLQAWYHDAGQFYFYDVQKFIKVDGMCEKIIPLVVSELEVQDIDNEIDWQIAEMKYRVMEKKESSCV